MTHIPEIWVPSRKFVEGGINIDFKPSAKWFVEVLDADGTVRPARGFEDGKFKKNLILNGYRDYLCSYYSGSTSVITDLFLTASWGNPYFQIGTSANAAVATQTNLVGFSKYATSFNSTGNSIDMSSSGVLTVTIKQKFAAEVGSATYNEVGHTIANGSEKLINRFVFPTPVSVTVGQIIILTMSFSFNTIYNTPQAVTLSDRGVNISGQLGLVGTLPHICGGTVTAAGVVSWINYWTLFPQWTPGVVAGNTYNTFALTGHNSIPAAGTDGSNMKSGITNSVTALAAGVNNSQLYVNGSYHRIHTGTWLPGNPAVSTVYNSLMCGVDNHGVSGYQLLFDNPQTFTGNDTILFNMDYSF